MRALTILLLVMVLHGSAAASGQQPDKPAPPGAGTERSKVVEPGSPRALTQVEVLATYAEAVRYFNPRLGEPEAEFVAHRILEESQAFGLDARLLVAVLAGEGTIRRTLLTPDSSYPGKETALKAVANASRDLRRRIWGHAKGEVTRTTIRQALVDRRRALPGGAKTSAKEVESYVDRIERLYQQMCGIQVGATGERAPAPSGPKSH